MKLAELLKIKRKAEKTSTSDQEIRQKDYLKLFQLMRAHRLLQMRVVGDTQSYQTVLLEVNGEQGCLVIDEPFPYDGVLSGSVKQTVVLEYERDGFCTRFYAVVEARIEEDGDKYYQLSWPEKVEEIQRRDQFRLDLSGVWTQQVAVRGVKDQKITAVMDLSPTGLRVAMAGNQVESVYAGSYLQNILLEFPGSTPIQCHLDITHCHYVPNVDSGQVETTIAGGRLEGLTDRERQAIQRFIYAMQRAKLREQLDTEQQSHRERETIAA